MYYIGIDVHKEFCNIQQMTVDGDLGFEMEVPTEKKALYELLDQLDGPVSITFEAGRNYWAFYQIIRDHPNVANINVVDPRRSRILAQELSTRVGYGRAKNDRIDAEMLAEQDRRKLTPNIHIPPKRVMEERALVRHRLDLVKISTSFINKLHSLLVMYGNDLSKNEFFNNQESREKAIAVLPVDLQKIVENYYELLLKIKNQITEIEQQTVALKFNTHPYIKLIKTVPGFGDVLSSVVCVEIWDIKRFEHFTNLMSYSGLAPIVDESAGKKGRIKLNPYSNRYLKYAFVYAAHHARRHPKFKKKYDADKKKHGPVRAKLNLARRLVKIVFWMLTRQQPFRD